MGTLSNLKFLSSKLFLSFDCQRGIEESLGVSAGSFQLALTTFTSSFFLSFFCIFSPNSTEVFTFLMKIEEQATCPGLCNPLRKWHCHYDPALAEERNVWG